MHRNRKASSQHYSVWYSLQSGKKCFEAYPMYTRRSRCQDHLALGGRSLKDLTKYPFVPFTPMQWFWLWQQHSATETLKSGSLLVQKRVSAFWLFRLFGKHPRVCGELSYITGAICDFAVWSHQQPRRHQSGQETPLCAKREVGRKHSTDESSPGTAHQAGSLSSWLLLGTSDDFKPWSSMP